MDKNRRKQKQKKNGDSAGVFRGYCHYSLMSMMRLRLIVTVLRYVRKCCTVQCSAAEASMTFHYLEKRQGFVHATNRWPFSSQWQWAQTIRWVRWAAERIQFLRWFPQCLLQCVHSSKIRFNKEIMGWKWKLSPFSLGQRLCDGE